MIVQALVAVFSITVFMAGAFAPTNPGITLMLSIPAGILLMFVYHLTNPDTTVRPASDGELTLRQLEWFLNDAEKDLVLYHENPFHPIPGFFKARIGGRTVLVMEGSH